MAGAGSIGGLPATPFVSTLLDDTDAPSARATLSAQEDLGVVPPTTGDAGAVLTVNPAGILHYDPTLTHGAHLTALSFGL